MVLASAVTPARVGIGLRPALRLWVESGPPAVECVEIVAEHFFVEDRGRFALPRRNAERVSRLAAKVPLVVHTLSASLGTNEPLDGAHLDALAALTAAASPLWVSGHIAFSRAGGIDLGHFAPVRPALDTAGVVAGHARDLAGALGVPILLENTATELAVRGTLDEARFIDVVCASADCGLLLDVDALAENARRHAFDPLDWLREIDHRRIVQLHVNAVLAGPDADPALATEVARLAAYVLERAPVRAAIIDRESGFPALGAIEQALGTLKRMTSRVASSARAGARPDRHETRRAAQPEAMRAAPAVTKPDALPVQPIPGMRLHFLGTGGVLHSSFHQEVHALNAAATFVWCCIEEVVPVDDIVERYRKGFGGDQRDVRAAVTDLLRRWQALGFVTGIRASENDDQAFPNALAILMRNPGLREAFRRSPERVAALLCVHARDRPSLLSMSAAQLDAQADATQRHRRWTRIQSLRQDDAPLVSWLERLRTPDWTAPPAAVRDYRLLERRVRIEFHTPAQFASVAPAFAHLETPCDSAPAATLRLVRVDEGHVVLVDGRPLDLCPREDALAPTINGWLRRVAFARPDFLLKFHAGVVGNGRSCVMLPAAAGSGKSTLVAALVARGFDYFSDEYALLDEARLFVRPAPLPLTVKSGSIGPLGELYPGLADLPAHHREDGKAVRYLAPPRPLPGRVPADGLPVGWIVFPRYVPGTRLTVADVDPLQALGRLMTECMVLSEDLDDSRVSRLVRWMRGVRSVELTLSSLAEGVDAVRSLCLAPGGER